MTPCYFTVRLAHIIATCLSPPCSRISCLTRGGIVRRFLTLRDQSPCPSTRLQISVSSCLPASQFHHVRRKVKADNAEKETACTQATCCNGSQRASSEKEMTIQDMLSNLFSSVSPYGPIFLHVWRADSCVFNRAVCRIALCSSDLFPTHCPSNKS